MFILIKTTKQDLPFALFFFFVLSARDLLQVSVARNQDERTLAAAGKMSKGGSL